MCECVYYLHTSFGPSKIRDKQLTVILKHGGLAHMHLLKNEELRGNFTKFDKPTLSALLLDLDRISWPTKNLQQWREWSLSRLKFFWGSFLKRKDARSISDFNHIQDIYNILFQ